MAAEEGEAVEGAVVEVAATTARTSAIRRPRGSLGIGLCYLAVIGFLVFRYLEIWLAPVPVDKTVHRKCVLIASEMAKGSDSAYKATYDLCVKGEFR